MAIERQHGAEHPYWPAGPFKIRLPFIHSLPLGIP